MPRQIRKPRIAVLLDENTSHGGHAYELNKDYIQAIVQAGGLPYALPYVQDFIQLAVHEFDGFYNVGGNIAHHPDWLSPGHSNLFPASERFDIETAMMRGFLEANKPILGSCHGMQILAGLYGCTLRCDVAPSHRLKEHHAHSVILTPGTQLAGIIGADRLVVNSRHSQAIDQVGPGVTVAGRADDGTIEAIEILTKKFAIGLQWHPENFWRDPSPNNRVFQAFVTACTPGNT